MMKLGSSIYSTISRDIGVSTNGSSPHNIRQQELLRHLFGFNKRIKYSKMVKFDLISIFLLLFLDRKKNLLSLL